MKVSKEVTKRVEVDFTGEELDDRITVIKGYNDHGEHTVRIGNLDIVLRKHQFTELLFEMKQTEKE